MEFSFIHILFFLIFVYCGALSLYFFIAAVAGRIRSKPIYKNNEVKNRIAVLIPAYKEDDIIVHSATSASGHDYPKDRFGVFIACDHMQPSTIERLKSIPVNVAELNFETGSKARSLNSVLNLIPDDSFDIAIILDADNIMLPGCLEKINDAFVKGFEAVQVHRMAKNLDSNVAFLDAISEEVNNHLFRRAQRALGFSASTIGSGMAFRFDKLKEIYNKPGILDNPACDREVDFEITKSGKQIEYIEDAYVLDEKVAAAPVFEKQRTRWLESQIIHLKLFFSSKENIRRKTKDYWNKLFTNLIPPRLFFLMAYVVVFLLFFIGIQTNSSIIYPSIVWWILSLTLYLSALFISIPRHLYSSKMFLAFFHLPALMLSLLKAVFKMKPGRREFVHTPKTYVEKQSSGND